MPAEVVKWCPSVEISFSKKKIMNKFLKKVLLICPIILLSIESRAQNITGTWQGNLDVQGNQIPIVFHIKKNSSNKWIAAFDSPSQHAFNLPCIDVIIKDNSIILMMAIQNGSKDGQVIAVIIWCYRNPGLNHLFQTCVICNPAEYNDLEESFSPVALEMMGSWLKENVQRWRTE